ILDPGITSGVLDWVLRNVHPPGQPEPERLSPQEQRIVAIVAEGKTNREIAAVLGLSPKTVKNYLHNIFEKLGISRRSQAAVMYARMAGRQHGLVVVPLPSLRPLHHPLGRRNPRAVEPGEVLQCPHHLAAA